MRKIKIYTAIYETDEAIGCVDYESEHDERSEENKVDAYRRILELCGPCELRQAVITARYDAESLKKGQI